MGRVVRSISMPPEMDKIVQENVEDFSEYVQECIKRDFMDQEQLDKKIKGHEDAISELKKLKVMPTINREKKDEEKYIKQMKEHSKMYGIKDALDNYNQRFGKNISMEKFRELIGE